MTAVHVRGLGAVSAYGSGVAPLVAGLQAGRPALAPLSLFRTAFGNEIKVSEIDRRDVVAGAGAAGAFELVASAVTEALAQARLPSLARCALLVGTSSFLFAAEAEYRHLQAQGQVAIPPLPAPGNLATQLAQRFAVGGPTFTFSTACSSSANAVLVARDLIARDEVDCAIVVGAEGLSAVSVGGFYSLSLLDPDGCRPFDAQRRGLQLGEGIGVLILDAQPSDAPIVRGGANLCDIHHVTSASPDGAAMCAVMRDALAHARLTPHDIVAIKAHGTGSVDNDSAEGTAMRSLFGDAPPPFTALKRYFGHTLGACGALETVAFLGCLAQGFIPASAGFSTTDPALNIAPLRAAQPARAGNYLFNFFGFGGNYASFAITHA